jgi:hypothetical protein
MIMSLKTDLSIFREQMRRRGIFGVRESGEDDF